MKKIIGSIILFIFAWKADYKEEFQIKKGVAVAAPHTSNWDLLFALAIFWKIGVNIKFLIKDSYTKSFLGFVFKAVGAVGVNREKGNNMVDFAAEILKTEDYIFLVPAEGTRKKVERWKTGFYHIAKKAEVPILLGFLDYKTKTGGFKKTLIPSDSFEKDMEIIQEYYLEFTAKYPEQYNPSIY